MNGAADPGRVVGFAGLGRMGAPMARRLHEAGLLRAVYNRSPEAARDFADAEVDVRSTPRELAADCEIVVTMLAGPEAVRAIALDAEQGLVGAGGTLRTIVDMSTVGPGLVAEMSAAAGSSGVAVVDAPVSGSVPAAEAGGLVVFAGGDGAAVAAVRPVFEPMAKAVHHVGGAGAGATLKLAVNGVLAQLNQALGEAIRLLEEAGVDLAAAYDAMADSVIAAPYLGYKRQAFLEPEAAAVAFTIEGLAKDARLAADLAAASGVATPGLDTTTAALERAVADGLGLRDIAEVARAAHGHAGRNID